MPSYATDIPSRPMMTDSFERTARRWPRSITRNREVEAAIGNVDQAVLLSTVRSEFLTRLTIFDPVVRALNALAEVPDDWNAYGSHAPSARSIHSARLILDLLHDEFLLPQRVLPSAEGGVAFTFLSRNQNRAVIESLNSGEEFILLYDRLGNSQTLDWSLNDSKALLRRLQEHLRGLGLAAS